MSCMCFVFARQIPYTSCSIHALRCAWSGVSAASAQLLFLSPVRCDAAKEGSLRASLRFSSSFAASRRSYSASSPCMPDAATLERWCCGKLACGGNLRADHTLACDCSASALARAVARAFSALLSLPCITGHVS